MTQSIDITNIVCKKCGSDNIYYSKKKQLFVCEDCNHFFSLEKTHKQLRIFLSYGHDRNAFVVNEIRKLLIEKGHNPWVDQYEIKGGDDWRIKITDGIKKSDNFIAFISNYSTRNPGVCLDEIAIAIGTKKCQIESVLLEKNATIPSSISTRQWIDLSDWKEKYENGNGWEKWLRTATKELIETIENPKNIQKSNELTYIQKELNPITPDIKLRQLLCNDIIGRNWLIDIVYKWYASKHKCLLIFGGPGTGKSVLSSLLANYDIHAAGIYFIEWNNTESRRVYQILTSILFQLCCNIDDYRKYITNKNLHHFENNSNETILNEFILTPLNNLIDGEREQKYFIIDALDELTVEANHNFYDVLRRLIDNSPRWIRWVISSRPESSIATLYSDAYTLKIDTFNHQTNDDIRAFCKQHLNNQEIVNAVVSKSMGSFVYAKTLVNDIVHGNLDMSTISRLPKSLSQIYFNNFRRIFKYRNYNVFRPFLCCLLYCQEPLDANTIKQIIGIDDDSLKIMIDVFRPFLSIDINKKNEHIFSIFHKSLSDWIVSDESFVYKISATESHLVFANYIQNHISWIQSNEYLTKYSITHMRGAKRWATTDFEIKKSILTQCITASDTYGNLYFEKQFLNIYKEEIGTDMNYLTLLLKYLQKTSGKEIEETTAQLLKLCDSCHDEELRFNSIIKSANALFYIGKDWQSRNIILRERKKHTSEFWNNELHESMYFHSLCLSAHDLDYNDEVVFGSDKSAQLYAKQNNGYKYLISIVNKFDALMGCGNIPEAFDTANVAFRLNEEKYYVHVDDILNICYANLLQTVGRTMESLVYYEKGLRIAKKIHLWDYLYGSIWRELAIARFGDKSCLERLLRFSLQAKEAGYHFLSSLGYCFFLMSHYILNTPSSPQQPILEKLNIAFDEVMNLGYPGHIAMAYAAFYIKKWKSHIHENLTYNIVAKSIIQCNGIKGFPDVIHDFFNQCFESNSINRKLKTEKEWSDKYLDGIFQYRIEYKKENFEQLSVEPLLSIPDCVNCEAKCCYDGVYLDQHEVEQITQFVAEYPEYFNNLPQEYIVQGTWEGLKHLKKTATRTHVFSKDFPSHFEHTRCVFCSEKGMCILQYAATELQMHPWAIKPRACWSFPIHGVKNGIIIAPPKIGEKDPNYVGPEYPGYVTCLPCGKAQLQGVSWKDIYKNEIEYYIYLINSGVL